MEIGPKELDRMYEAELEHQQMETRKTSLDILNVLLEQQKRIIERMQVTLTKAQQELNAIKAALGS